MPIISVEQNELLSKLDELDKKEQTELQKKFSSCPYGFWEYLKYRDEKFFNEDRKDLKLYAVALMLLELGHVWNLAVSMPRRRGKSYTLSRFTAFSIGRNPTKSNTRNSNAKRLSEKFSRHIRKFITDEKYKKLFPHVKLQSKSVEEWSITLAKQHTFLAGGVDGGTTGSGTNNLLVGDDLIKGMKEATSPAYRNALAEFITGIYESGREPGMKRIETATRWVDDDPIGEVLSVAERLDKRVITFDAYETLINDEEIDKFAKKIIDLKLDDEEWIYIKIPALNKWDLSTAETIQPTEKLKLLRKKFELRNAMYMWECIYQQNPKPKEGKLFPEEDLNYFYYEDVNENLSEIMFIDPAGKGSNNTCGVICKVENEDKIYVYDIVYTPEEPKISKPICAKKIMEHKKYLTKISGEGNFGGDIYLETLEAMLVNSGVNIKIKVKASSENKETKIFINSDAIKNTFLFPYKFDRNGNRQYEVDSPMDKAINSLTKYLGKVKGQFVTNQEDDFPDALVGVLRMLNEPETGFNVRFV